MVAMAWSQLSLGDWVWLTLFLAVAIAPYISAYLLKTPLSLATVLSIIATSFMQMLCAVLTAWGFGSFNPVMFGSMVPMLATEPTQIHRFITAGWLHSGWLHVLSNLLVIGLVGVPLETRLGPRRWLAVYLLGLLGGNITWWLAHFGEFSPAIGASGAAFGLLGGYLACWPADRIEFPLFIFIRAWPVSVIALFRLGLEVLQMTMIEVGSASASNIAHLAHVGGFFATLATARFIARGGPIPLDHIDTGPNETSRLSAVRDRLREGLGDITNDPWNEAGSPLSGTAARVLDRLRDEGDELETRRAWLEELAEHAKCPVCDGKIQPSISDEIVTLRCDGFDSHMSWP
jgi:membrane associated rhomboid family serine protease